MFTLQSDKKAKLEEQMNGKLNLHESSNME